LANSKENIKYFNKHCRQQRIGRNAWAGNRFFRNQEQLIEYSMKVEAQIKKYITEQPEPKRSDMEALHRIIMKIKPACKLWFLDGKNSENKTVSNPNIGYGAYSIKYADGKNKEFYQIGMSANTTGISVYILGIKDKTYSAKTYEKKLGKAKVTGYCIKFKTLKDINIDILEAAIRYGFENSAGSK